MNEEEQQRDLKEGRMRVNPVTGKPYDTTSWAAVDLTPWLEGKAVTAPPRWLPRKDGKALIYPGKPHTFFGESESLKSWAALLAVHSVVAAGSTALYIDLEGAEAPFVERARHVGISDRDLKERVGFIRPTEPLADDRALDLMFEMQMRNPALAVLDGVSELYALQGWDINKATDAAKFHALFYFGDQCASINIDHTAKDAGRGVIGSQHKRAGLDGAEYEFISRRREGRGGISQAEVRVTKDRHGFVREWASDVVGFVEVAPDGVTLRAPAYKDYFDPRTDAMAKVIDYLMANPGQSRRAITKATRLRDERAGEAIATLKFQGRIRNEGTDARPSWVVVEDE